FTAVAVLSLALGIGANTAIFQLIDAIRLRALPVANPQELAFIDFGKDSKRSGWWSTRSANFTSAQWDSIRTHQQAFSGMIAWSAKEFNLVQEGKGRYAEGLFVNGEFFNVLRVPAAIGRPFTKEDDLWFANIPSDPKNPAFLDDSPRLVSRESVGEGQET